MNKNQLIKKALSTKLESLVSLNKTRSFKDYLKQVLEKTKSASYSFEEWKMNDIKDIVNIQNQKLLIEEVEKISNMIADPHSQSFQSALIAKLQNSFEEITQAVNNNNQLYDLNLLFVEIDNGSEAVFYGFNDETYKFELLSGTQYLDFNPEKYLFEGIGEFNFSDTDISIWNIEEKYEALNFDLIQDFIEPLKELYIINTYYGIHICCERTSSDLLGLNIPIKQEIYFFGSEHDCEQHNIYVFS